MFEDDREFAVLDKNARTFTCRFWKGFGNECDADGHPPLNSEADLEEARKVFNAAIDMMLGRRRMAFSVERWVRMRSAASSEESKS